MNLKLSIAALFLAIAIPAAAQTVTTTPAGCEGAASGAVLADGTLCTGAGTGTGTTTGTGTGTGLGLALVRGLAEVHGGRAWLESEEGTGTRAFVALPAAVTNVGRLRA